jgi:hypothetical protein
MAHAFAAMHLVAIGLNGHSGHAGECQLSVKADVTADIAKATLLTHLGSRVCGVAVETMTIEPANRGSRQKHAAPFALT